MEPRQPRAFDPDAAIPKVPEDLTGHMLYFLDVGEVPIFAPLHRKLLLISEDNNQKAGESNMVFGYLMNEPLAATFQDHFGKAAQNFPSRFRFLQIMNSAAKGFEPPEAGFITFLTRRGESLGTLNERIFDDFAAYTCETLEEANAMEKFLKEKQDIVIVHSLFAIEREKLEPLIRKSRVLVRPATPEIMLNQSAFMRTMKAFPESAPNLTL